MNCNQAQDLFIDLIYEETDLETRKALEKHLESCTDCATALEDLKQVRQMCSSLEDPQPSPIAINRILALAREEADRRPPFWGFGWMKVLSMVCVAVIAGGIVMFHSESGWFHQSMPAALLDTAPAEPSIKRSTTIEETRPAVSLTAASVPSSTLAKTAELASPPVGLITTGTSTPVHPQASQATSGQVRVSINMQQRSLPPAPARPAPGSDGGSGPRARSPGASYHTVNTGTFTIETYFSTNRSLDMSSPGTNSPDLIQPEMIISIEAEPQAAGNPPRLRMASRGVRLAPTEKTSAVSNMPATRPLVPVVAPQSPNAPVPSPLNQDQNDMDLDHHLKEGRTALEAGLFREAIYHLEHSIHLMTANHPQRPHVLNHLARAYEKNGDVVKARSLYLEIVSKYPYFREIAEQRLRTLAAE